MPVRKERSRVGAFGPERMLLIASDCEQPFGIMERHRARW